MSRLRPLLLLALCAAPVLAAEPSALSRAEEQVRQASLEKDPQRREALLTEAEALCDEAARKQPADPVPLIIEASARAMSDPRHPELCRPGQCDRAVGLLEKARTLDKQGVEARRISFELAIIYSRMGAHEHALVEYQRCMRTIDSARVINEWDELGSSPELYGNAAETQMALGRLDEAIASYRRSIEIALQKGKAWELAQWGLGLALDRDEQEENARSAVRRAIDIDPAMRHLSDDDVFFEPPGEKWAYLALGHEVAGDRDQAINAWRTYLGSSPPNPRYARRARAHLKDLQRAVAGPDELERLKVEVGTIERLGGGRPIPELRDTMRGYVEDLRLCYARALRTRPHLEGQLDLALEIHPVGVTVGGPLQPPRVVAERSTIALPLFTACVESAASAWRFKTIDSQLDDVVVVTLGFSPGGK
jgi:tetratricopeptide (TPR) repeat protein